MKEPILQIPSTQITIRRLHLQEEFDAAYDVQAGLPEFRKVGLIPSYYMKLVNSRGGLVLGCFDGNRLVGYNYAFPCISSSLGIYLFADSMGFLKTYQKKHLGYCVKKLQYSLALSMGIRYIVWTYDPLKGVNANINIRKLGARILQYLPDQYTLSNTLDSRIEDTMQAALPQDRFEVCWDIFSEEVKRRMENPNTSEGDDVDQIPIMNSTVWIQDTSNINTNSLDYSEHFFQKIESIRWDYQSPNIRIEIPVSFIHLEEKVPSLAIDWRIKSRQIFQNYFNNSYQIEGFCHQKETKRNFYILKKRSDRSLP
ncbi:MAG: hypothetical protein PHX86_01875 [Caldisericia bacterium]|nr:hypothetical protein [Caldisericia bacterium]